MSPLFRHFSRTLLYLPSTGIFLGFGWMFVTLLTLAYGEFIPANHAGLELMYGYLPWVLCLLVPALSMTMADEPARGVHERLHTLPFTPVQHLLARFGVYWGLVGLWLLGLWPLAASVFWLGSPDVGPMLSGLLGSWLFSAPLLAASLWVCSRASNGVMGFLMALGICLALTLVGAPQTVSWLKQTLPVVVATPLATVLQTATPLAAYQQFVVGFPALGGTLLLAALTLGFLMLAWPGKLPLSRYPAILIPLGLAAVAVLPVSGRMGVDVTADRLHTLSPATISYLKALPKPIEISFYQSRNNPDIPLPAISNAVAVRQLLARIQAVNPSKISITEVNPDETPAVALQALQAGVEEQVLPSGTGFFSGLRAQTPGGNPTLIRVFDPSRRPFLEFDVMALLTESLRTHKPRIALLSNINYNEIPVFPRWMGDLALAYDMEPMPTEAHEITDKTDLLIIAGNYTLTDETLTAIKNYLENGGKVVWLADPLWRSLPEKLIATGGTRTLADFFNEAFGIDVHPDEVVADLTQATPVAQEGVGYTTYPFWLGLDNSNLAPDQPFATFVSHLLLGEPGRITAAKLQPGLKFSPIITSSPNAQTLARATFVNTPAELVADQLKSPKRKHVLAAMVTGTFGQGTKPATLMVVNDADWLANSFALRALPTAGGPPEYEPQNSNLVLFYNMLQYALGETALVDLRGKATTPRTLTRVEALLSELSRRTTQLEQKTAAQLYEVSQHLAELKNQKPEAGDDTSADTESTQEVRKYQQQQFLLRQQLREYRNQARRQIQGLETALLMLNLLTMPVLLAIGLFWHRRRAAKRHS